MCVGPKYFLWACKDKGQGSDQVGSAAVCVCRFLCGDIFPHRENVVMLSVGQAILHVLGSYNGNVETGKKWRLDEDWCRSTRRDKQQKGCKNGRCKWPLDEQISKIPAHLRALSQDTQTGRQKPVGKSW